MDAPTISEDRPIVNQLRGALGRNPKSSNGVGAAPASSFTKGLVVNGRPLGASVAFQPGVLETAAPRYVIYQYCISILVMTFKRGSGIKVIEPGQSAVVPGLPYTLVSLVAGWWGIPWGPIYTIQSVFKNLRGGIDVTDEINALIAADLAAAATDPTEPTDPPRPA
jgi:hypothetical protein